MQPDYDLCVIGGGINGAGIARDAAGRGLSVLLVEAQDLAQGTSSASTKLIHGGLRYLENGEFKLVAESLKERSILMNVAPHLVSPLDFVMPHVPGLRPRWMIGFGLWLYDRLGGRSAKLSKSSAVSLHDSLLGEPLMESYRDGFKYTDCWTDDARLVVLNAMDAKARGAEILTRTACMQIGRMHEADVWYVKLKDLKSNDEFQISARMIINAAGPWVRGVLEASNLVQEETPKIRLVKGSHIIVPRLYEGDHAYILQQPDKRVIFAIPYQENYTLVGTTDEPFDGDAMKPVISAEEKDYLCAAINRFFGQKIEPAEILWTYSGVRALFDDGKGAAQSVTRDYRLDLDTSHGAPLLSVFGGKLTTYRHLSQLAVDRITGARKNSGWTIKAPLPGGDIPAGDIGAYIASQAQKYKFLPDDLLRRYAQSYGTKMDVLMDGIDSIRAMGRDFGGSLYEAEILYLIKHEFAQTAEDILWRRTKLGLYAEKKTMLALEAAMPDYIKERKAAS
jgi:glycerol-3-phosphate dehydrogenase